MKMTKKTHPYVMDINIKIRKYNTKKILDYREYKCVYGSKKDIDWILAFVKDCWVNDR